MSLLLIGLAIVILAAAARWAANPPRRASRRADTASLIGAGGALVGCGIAFAGALRALLASGRNHCAFRGPWRWADFTFSSTRSPRSSCFRAGTVRMRRSTARNTCADTPAAGHRLLVVCYNLLIASMALVIVAADGVLFLVAWEVMALSSFFLVAFEHERRKCARRRGPTDRLASRTAFIVAFS